MRTDRHTPMNTRPCGLRRAGKNAIIGQEKPKIPQTGSLAFLANSVQEIAWKNNGYCGSKIPRQNRYFVTVKIGNVGCEVEK